MFWHWPGENWMVTPSRSAARQSKWNRRTFLTASRNTSEPPRSRKPSETAWGPREGSLRWTRRTPDPLAGNHHDRHAACLHLSRSPVSTSPGNTNQHPKVHGPQVPCNPPMPRSRHLTHPRRRRQCQQSLTLPPSLFPIPIPSMPPNRILSIHGDNNTHPGVQFHREQVKSTQFITHSPNHNHSPYSSTPRRSTIHTHRHRTNRNPTGTRKEGTTTEGVTGKATRQESTAPSKHHREINSSKPTAKGMHRPLGQHRVTSRGDIKEQDHPREDPR